MLLPKIERNTEMPIRRQIYEQIKAQILGGNLAAGDALPSTRQLAAELNIARSTAVEAYDMLLAEGFLTSSRGSKTVVADGIALLGSAPAQRVIREKPKHIIRADFSTGRPDIDGFPRGQWRKIIQKAANGLSADVLGYTGPQGYLPLREEIASWLARARGIVANPNDIFITAGATHALRITADMLCPRGGRVVMEDPCHKGLYDTLLSCGCEVRPVPADDRGIQVELIDGNANASMIYVTPSHQFPLGGILPAARRTALIQFARDHDVWIVEDDYDSEFRYTGEPVAPLYSMDSQRVIYVGTFSKTLFPALRIGFVILPNSLHGQWRELRTHHDVQNPILEQVAMAEFLRSRAMDRHVRTMKKRYAQRRAILMSALTEEFGPDWTTAGDAAGLHVAVRFFGKKFDESFRARCREEDIVAVPVETHCIVKGQHGDQLVLGYGHLEPEQIVSGVSLLASVMREK